TASLKRLSDDPAVGFALLSVAGTISSYIVITGVPRYLTYITPMIVFLLIFVMSATRFLRWARIPVLTMFIAFGLLNWNGQLYPSEDFIALVLEVRPAQVTLVPDPPGVLTSNAGWDAREHKMFLKEVLARFKREGIRTSVFMGTDPEQLSHAADTGTDRVELYTEPYAANYHKDRASAVAPFANAAEKARQLGLGLNAGHDLDLHNLAFFNANVPGLQEVSIGHALVCDALMYGMENTVGLYLRELR
ncbi:MAG TPA: pyridoxine 5'-phosphate synthase, partial [Flavobacteriales bacterium]|nr:pyridoxine 5'-phosphate synthase [Flavobacteriales bacterium]